MSISSNRQIVCISQQYWDDPWFRKQQFMHRFALGGVKVCYVEPSFSAVRKKDEYRQEYQLNKVFRIEIEKRLPNLYILKPPKAFPFWTDPFVSRINYKYFSFFIANALKKLGFNDYLLWIYQPEYYWGLKFFRYNQLLFDLTDNLAAFQKNPSKRRYIQLLTDNLLVKSNIIFVTSSTLLDVAREKNNNAFLVPNGYDRCLFNVNQSYRIPEELKGIKTPIIGFVGSLFSFLDYDLIEYLLKAHPLKSFVFIGNCESNCLKRWTQLTSQYPNLIWLGKKPKEDIPSFVNSFNVCINPFKIDEVSRNVSPLKVFEYLALHKPVVSVNMESLKREKVANLIYFSDTYESFSNMIDLALSFLGKNFNEYKVVEDYSWDLIYEAVFNILLKSTK